MVDWTNSEYLTSRGEAWMKRKFRFSLLKDKEMLPVLLNFESSFI